MILIVFSLYAIDAKIKIKIIAHSLANKKIWLYFCVTSLNNSPILSEYPFPQLP